MRTIKVFSTATGLTILQSEAKTWSELKSELLTKDIDVSNMRATENRTNTNLVLDEAQLPENDFVLMLSPEKTKSGGYTDTRTEIQNIIKEYGEEAKSHFNVGKNYTLKTYSELMNLLDAWYEKMDDSNDEEDNDDEFNEVEFNNCLDRIIYDIRNCEYYSLRPDDMEKAIELISGKDQLDNLSNEERNWVEKQLGNL